MYACIDLRTTFDPSWPSHEKGIGRETRREMEGGNSATELEIAL